MYKDHLAYLNEHKDLEYRTFSQKLLPGVEGILGVRLPAIQALAKNIIRNDWKSYLASPSSEFFEETMLRGMVIAGAPMPFTERLAHIASFVPYINNWSVCDSFCSRLKDMRSNRAEGWDFLLPYCTSSKEYDVRFAVVTMLFHYQQEEYLNSVFSLFDAIRHEGYYARMGVAWAISACFVSYPEKTWQYLNDNRLDDFTFAKALQKIVESRRVSASDKKRIQGLR